MVQNNSYILLIEDDTDHAELIMEELETLNIESKIVLLKDGREAIDYIQKTNTNDEKDIQIELVILDLNLPKVHGMDVLRFIRKHPVYRSVPVVILSTSSDNKTISEAYENGANDFVTKSAFYEEFTDKKEFIKKYINTN